MKSVSGRSKLTGYVVFSIAIILAYTSVCLIFNMQNDTMTTCFFSVFGGEILTCALIKIFKIKRENSND